MNETETRQTAGLGAEMPAGQDQSATDAGQGAGMPGDARQGAGIATDAGQAGNITATHVVDMRPPIRPDASIANEAARLDALLARLFSHQVRMQEGNEVKTVTVADLSAPVRIGMIYEHVYNFFHGAVLFFRRGFRTRFNNACFQCHKRASCHGRNIQL